MLLQMPATCITIGTRNRSKFSDACFHFGAREMFFIHLFVPDISIAPNSSPQLHRGASDYSIYTVSELTRRSATGNYE